MSTLENCTEALLQQKVVQASNYERLESRLMEMERTKRSLFFGLKEIITDVERRQQDLGELRDENARLQQQLQHGAVKFGALSAFMGEEQKKSVRLRGALESCATAWTGCPARAAHLLRALQERSAFHRQLSDIVTTFNRVRDLVVVVQRVEATRGILQERLDEQDRGVEQMNGVLHQLRQEEDGICKDLQQRMEAAHDESHQHWCNVQQRERSLLLQNATLAASLLETSAMEGYNVLCRAALQEALVLSDVYSAGRERVFFAARFAEWRCMHIRESLAAVELQTHAVTDAMSARVAVLDAQQQVVVRESEQAVHERESLCKAQDTSRGVTAALERRVSALNLLRAAVRAFRWQEQTQLLHVRHERAEREAAVTSARAAHESRMLAWRLQALQQEAREGLFAEESLTRGALVNAESGAHRSLVEQHVQVVKAALESQKRQQEPGKVVAELCGHTSRHVTPSKPLSRRSRTTNPAAHAEKKRPRSRAESSRAAPQRTTYPEMMRRRQGEEDEGASPASSASSLGGFLTLGTRLPLSALKTSQCSPPLQPISTNVKGNKRGKKSSDTVVRHHCHANSPLPRPPANAPCALSHALNSAIARTGRTTTLAGVVAANAAATHSSPHPPLLSSRPRPSVAAAAATKDMWGGVKVDDVFADVFSF